MSPPSPIPEEWWSTPPRVLVVGNGPLAATLAQVLASVSLTLDELQAGPARDDHGGFPLVLDHLERVVLVCPETATAAEMISHHDALWKWVEKLTRSRDEHELAVVFAVPAAPAPLPQQLASGLSVPTIDPAACGYAVWRWADPLEALLAILASTRQTSLGALRTRRAADIRYAALISLKDTLARSDIPGISVAVGEVLSSFAGREYLLGEFCRPPHHLHGSQFRQWLRAAVIAPVTPSSCARAAREVRGWLL